jgi:hypothetical protein
MCGVDNMAEESPGSRSERVATGISTHHATTCAGRTTQRRPCVVLGSECRQRADGGDEPRRFGFHLVNAIVSLIGIVTGFVAMKGMLASQRLNDWTAAFLATTTLTSLTGFGFPFETVLPSHIFGIAALLHFRPDPE